MTDPSSQSGPGSQPMPESLVDHDHGHNTGHGDHHGPAHLAHHFETSAQQMETGKLGMWIFLATEILMFGGLFCAYAVYRANHPDVFLFAHRALDTNLGAINTGVLLASSFTMAWGVRAAQLGQRTILIVMLILTLCGGAGFMVIKTIEYTSKYDHGLWVGGLNAFYQESGQLRDADKAEHAASYIEKHGQAEKDQTHGDGDLHSQDHGAPDEVAGDHGADLQDARIAADTGESGHGASVADYAGGLAADSAPEGASAPVVGEPLTVAAPEYPKVKPSGLAGVESSQIARPTDAMNGVIDNLIQSPVRQLTGVETMTTGMGVQQADLHGRHYPSFAELDRREEDTTHIFFQIYFIMTGLHGIHVVVGMGLLAWILIKSIKGVFSPAYYTPVDLVGLYWHLVDLIWIFLFPLLYLIH